MHMVADRFVLGAAQLGMDYGISNAAGRPSREAAQALLAYAAQAGIGWIDTAAAYGESEQVLGALAPPAMRIITKTAPGGVEAAKAGFERSLETLQRSSVDALLVHSAADLIGPEGEALWRLLSDTKAAGAAARIGFSAYIEHDPLALAARFPPDLVQVPLSVLDQRLLRSGVIAGLAQAGVEVHARSIFLQGALLMSPLALPAELARFAPILAAHQARWAAAEMTPLAAAIRFALEAHGIAKLVVGVNHVAELAAILAISASSGPALNWAEFAFDDPAFLDPRGWEGKA